MKIMNRPAWLFTLALLSIVTSPSRAFTQSAAGPAYKVRIIYLIPSNREPQPNAEQILQRYALRAQTLYRENMARQGYSEKTFELETEADGTIPKVHVERVPQGDFQFQDPDYLTQWANILNGVVAAGFTPFAPGEVLWVIPEMHEQLADGTILPASQFVGGAGTGSAGLAAVSGDFLARMPASFLTDDRNYQGLVIPAVGPFPLSSNAFPFFEGSTVSSTSSSAQGAAAHELGHGFALPHDFTNDENFFGNLMGNGLRGFRGFLYPERYPDSHVDLSAATALHLNNSPFFNAPAPSGPGPSIFILGAGTVGGLFRFDFRAVGGALAGAVLRRNGNAVASVPLSGTTATATISTYDYEPGITDTWELVVYDSQWQTYTVGRISTFAPVTGINRAPFTSIRVSKSALVPGEPVALDAGRSFDPDGDRSQLQVEWDLNGDGTFDTAPSVAKILNISFAVPGTYQITARLTDVKGDSSVSSPIGVRVEPANVNGLVRFEITNSRFTPDATGCPSDYAGRFFVDALLTNRSEMALSRMRIGIARLTEGALLLGTKTVFEEGQYLDAPGVPGQQLASGEAVSVPFALCLEKRAQFEFFVNVHAVTN